MSPAGGARGKKKVRHQKRDLELFHFWSGPEQRPVDVFIDKFEENNPYIKVSRNVLNWEILMAAIHERMIRGSPPDVVSNEVGQRLLRFVKLNQLADLTDVWEKEDFFGTFPEWMVENCSYGGKIYGVPSKRYVFAVWYLTDTFKKHGIKPPTSWREFIGVCEAFKEAGVHPIIASGWETMLWFNHILAGIEGAEFYNKLIHGRESWMNSKVIAAYETLLELVRKYFYPHPFGYRFQFAWERLNKGDVAMQLQGDWVNGMWQRKYRHTPGAEHDFFLLPPVNSKIGQIAVMGGNVWMVPSEASHPKEAKAFVEYAGSLEAHETLAREGMGILARRDVPRGAYDPISARLNDECAKCQTVLEMNCALPPRLAAVEERQRMQMILSPTIKREEIEKLCAETEIAARENLAVKFLIKYGFG